MSSPLRVWPFNCPALPCLALFSLQVEDVVESDMPQADEWPAYAMTARRKEFAAGRICSAAALQALGGDSVWLPMAKPYRYPKFPKDFKGSITHTHECALACAGDAERYLAIGLDAEPMVEHAELEQMANYVLSPNELNQFKKMSGEQALTFFYLCFSAKETLFKTLFPLCHTDMEFTESELASWNDEGIFTLRLITDRVSDRFENGTLFCGLWSVHVDTLLTLLALPRKQALPTLDSHLYVPDFSYGRP
ncbi:4'-phosphopantetheinyl transferase entD [Pseudomonas sp. R4-34-07]|uniref:4'-phosphopantetheinyl transferase family protein n=1 Tax=Pseudomonas sp. R4-34-07 TaxID=658642 RepID=UPI000F583B99|nr:4'-phosphopantetheinyl transferase superfamily protein [Pseudomonas sp. R4-34-07]AZF53162.1 4'-phosphopantetheinyl transferase entD [Pseudomonas sp. R4-34-07]